MTDYNPDDAGGIRAELHALKAPPRADATDVSLKEYTDLGRVALSERIHAEHQALREHIDAQYHQIDSALDAARREFALAQTAEEAALAKAEQVLHTRMDDGDKNLREHIVQQGVAVEAALESARREAAFARDASDKALSKMESSLRVRIDEGDERLREHVQQQYGQIAAALESARRETGFAHAASEKAILKAETANEKRFESVNEFRAQLADQTSTFLPREVAEAQFSELRRAIADLTEKVGKLA